MQKTDSKSSIKIGDLTLKSNVVSSPLAGITDYVFRKIVRKYNPNILLTTEMISSEALRQHSGDNLVTFSNNESPIAFQIVGHKPELMVKAAKMLENKADIIDINMGCPVNKVIKSGDGCAMMNTPEKAADIVKAVKDTVDIPVTCKIRLGMTFENMNFVKFAVKMREAGADAVCVHARTRSQMYGGIADWKKVSELNGEIDIPYFINGDITSPESAKKALELSKADGIVIGRGLIGNPVLPLQISEFLTSGKIIPDLTLKEKLKVLKEHLEGEVAFRGEINGVKFFRKFYPFYIKGIRGSSEFRKLLVTVKSLEEAEKIIDKIILSEKIHTNPE